MQSLDSQLTEISSWRGQVLGRIREWLDGLKDLGLAADGADAEFERIRQAAAGDRVSVAFVAEFSRGKSELINALFFSGYGRRVVPSGAGRTTMCPTEIMYDPTIEPCIRLLPIETRALPVTLLDLKNNTRLWVTQAIDHADADNVAMQLMRVKETKFVERREAEQLGLTNDVPASANTVEIPRWRHAIVNLPHPLLKQGLTIIDTPGLNALGNEPELTLSVLPSATAVLYVLAADAGVSKSDSEVWRTLLATMPRSGRFVVLNKIDGLWDDMRSRDDIAADIYRQTISVAHTLDVPEGRVFALSAMKALTARISQNPALEERSQIRDLEYALTNELLPARRNLLAERFLKFVDEVAGDARAVLESRLASIDAQTEELTQLEQGGGDIAQALIERAKAEKAAFQQAFQALFALRSVVSRSAKQAIQSLSATPLKDMPTRMGLDSARSGKELRAIFDALVDYVRKQLGEAQRQCREAHSVVVGMQKQLAVQHRLSIQVAKPFSMDRYNTELDTIERAAVRAFPNLPIMLPGTRLNAQRMIITANQHIIAVVDKAVRDATGWLNTLTAPLDRQMRDQQNQLRRREESLARMLDARQSLAERLGELAEIHSQAASQQEELNRTHGTLRNILR
jgi:hypothetical protein